MVIVGDAVEAVAWIVDGGNPPEGSGVPHAWDEAHPRRG
jgi:hypothetical protein